MAVRDMLVLAERGEASALVASSDPLAEGWTGHRLEQVDAATLSLLGAVLRGDPSPAIDAFDWPRLAAADEEDGPWVYELPEELAGLLRDARPSEDLLRRWTGSHDLMEYCDSEVLQAQLTAIGGLLEVSGER